MRLKVTDDGKFLQVVSGTQLEIEQLEVSFAKKVDNYFIIKKKVPHWNGIVRFIDQYSRIPLGLWGEVKKLGAKYNFPISIEKNNFITDSGYSAEDLEDWIADHFKNSKIKPRYYQTEAVKRALYFLNCTEEISTSGGKTLISYMLFRYLFDRKKIKRMLYVVPNVCLVEQSEDKFFDYDEACGLEPNWESQCIFGGAKKRRKEDVAELVFGTFQSLSKKDAEYFESFDIVMVDETHHAKANSIKSILVKCHNAKWKIGLSGSLPKEGTCDSFTIQAYLGPNVYTLASHQLIDEGNATPVHIIGLELDYLAEETKKNLYDLRNVSADEKDGAKLLNLEKQLAREDRKRFNYICETIMRSSKNSLVLFSDIKNGYGKSIYDWFRGNTEKNAYYIDGSTDPERRELYKKKMESEEDVIIIASIGVFSEGIDILNLHNIYIIETSKSDVIVRQILGRGMRLMQGKDKITVFDFSDNFKYKLGTNKYQEKNYLLRHSDERQRIYKEKRFPYKKFIIKL